MTLRVAAAQFFGAVVMIPIAASLIIGVAAFVVMRLYMRAVSRESGRHSPYRQRGPEEEFIRPAVRLEHAPLDIQIEQSAERVRAQPQRTFSTWPSHSPCSGVPTAAFAFCCLWDTCWSFQPWA